VKKTRACHEAVLEARVMLIEAESDVAGLKERNIDIVRQLEEEKHRAKEAQRELDEFKAIAGRALEAVTAIQADPENEEHLESWKNLAPELTVDDLKAQIIAENTRLEFVVASNPNAMNEFKRRQVEVDKLTRKVVETEEELEDVGSSIAEIREQWEPQLDTLISEISEAFSHNFEQIGCAGQVGVHKDDDFDLWQIQIKVKFRYASPILPQEPEANMQPQRKRRPPNSRLTSTIWWRTLSLDHLLPNVPPISGTSTVPCR